MPAVLAAALALPGTALGQGAGDDQYSDPFGGEQEQQQATPQPTATPAPAQPAPAQPAPAQPAPEAAPSQAQPTPQQLPMTGAEAWPAALAGALLLAGGVALRVRLGRHPH
jgi:LPXTG-motif cell wall-anchored protein